MELPLLQRVLPDGRGVWIYPQTYSKARIVVGPLSMSRIDDGW